MTPCILIVCLAPLKNASSAPRLPFSKKMTPANTVTRLIPAVSSASLIPTAQGALLISTPKQDFAPYALRLMRTASSVLLKACVYSVLLMNTTRIWESVEFVTILMRVVHRAHRTLRRYGAPTVWMTGITWSKASVIFVYYLMPSA